MEFWGGRLLASLAALGLTPDDIDLVVYSHLHVDHVGWTTDHTREALHLRTGASRDVARRMGLLARRRTASGGPDPADIDALAERVELTRRRAHVAPGISLVPTPGHTPGHCSLLRVVGHRARGRARRRDPLPAPDLASRVGVRRRRQPPGGGAGPRGIAAASSTRRTRPSSVRTSPTRCSAGCSADRSPGGSRSTSRPRRPCSRLAPEAPPGEVFLPPLS